MPAPSFDDSFGALRDLLILVHAILADGIDHAHRVEQENPQMAQDACLWSGLVRAFCVKQLPAEIADEPYVLERAFNLSVTVHGRDYSVRVRKAAPGELPSPGKSPGSLAYFNQQGSLFDWFTGLCAEEDHTRVNLILVWGTNEFRALSELMLAYPEPTEEGMPQKWFWAESVFDATKPGTKQVPGDLYEDLPDVDRKDEDEDDEKGTGTGPQ